MKQLLEDDVTCTDEDALKILSEAKSLLENPSTVQV